MLVKATYEDLEDLAALEQTVDPKSSWKYEQFVYEFQDNPYAHIMVIKNEDQIIGYIDYWVTFEVMQIANIAVKKQFQGQGYGKQLLAYAFEQASKLKMDSISLEVRVSNHQAISLYQKFGMVIASTRKQYYEDHEDAYLMVYVLGGNEDEFNLRD